MPMVEAVPELAAVNAAAERGSKAKTSPDPPAQPLQFHRVDLNHDKRNQKSLLRCPESPNLMNQAVSVHG